MYMSASQGPQHMGYNDGARAVSYQTQFDPAFVLFKVECETCQYVSTSPLQGKCIMSVTFHFLPE